MNITSLQNIQYINPQNTLKPKQTSFGGEVITNNDENRVVPYYKTNVTNSKNKLLTPKEKQMYSKINSLLDNKTKVHLENLLKKGRLLSRKSNDNSSTLENLYRITTEPRLNGLDNIKVLKSTIKTINNPYRITQRFGNIPESLKREIIYKENRFPSAKINKQDLNVSLSGTCVAASIEFNLAQKKPSEYARFVAGLTSPETKVESSIKYKEISPDIIDALQSLSDFDIITKPIDSETIKVELKPDKSALIRAKIQAKYGNSKTRSTIDVLLQSAFMQLGSSNTYNTLTDTRSEDEVPDGKGLTQIEKNFVETMVEPESKKISVTYQEVDDNLKLTGYAIDFETTKKHIKDSLRQGYNVIIGMTDIDKNKNIVGGHEITIIGTEKGKNGVNYFICNDTDDDYYGPTRMKESELIPKIHHAGIPMNVLGAEQVNSPGQSEEVLNSCVKAIKMLRKAKSLSISIAS